MEFVALAVLVAGVYVIHVLAKRVTGLRQQLQARHTELSTLQQTADEESNRLSAELARIGQLLRDAQALLTAREAELTRLRPFTAIADASAALKLLQARLQSEESDAKSRLANDLNALQEEHRQRVAAEVAKLQARQSKGEARIAEAGQQADQIIATAKARAEEISGDAYKALANIDAMKKVADALRNRIEGYRDRYIVPTYTLLDELADTYGFAEAGADLKKARIQSRLMSEQGRAAACDYVEENRASTAKEFVLDAFDGKVDSILTKLKADNYGTLRQQVIDAFALVNDNGQAFRNARITDEYLASRLEEVRLACTVTALRDRDREEQRRIREQIREEERAQKEFERAKREAERDEQVARKAVEKLEAQIRAASDDQRAAFEQKLREMQDRLAEAEAKGQRALSMAQQTKAGHVYIISNIGSFGEDVFKIGMTRRLEPLDRVAELGDASVPFPFDIHGMIYSDNAPGLEHKLHQQFLIKQMNKVNPRKEFFRLSLADIQGAVDQMGIKAQWTLQAQAAQYRESLSIAEAIESDAQKRREWEEAQMKIEAPEFTDEAIEVAA